MDMLKSKQLTSKMGSGIISGKLHNVVITEFVDKYFIIISSNGKIGSLVEISFETNLMKTSCILESKTLFGIDKPEILAVAQSIVEMLDLKKSVIFGFSTKEYSATAATNMKQVINEILKCNEKEKLIQACSS